MNYMNKATQNYMNKASAEDCPLMDRKREQLIMKEKIYQKFLKWNTYTINPYTLLNENSCLAHNCIQQDLTKLRGSIIVQFLLCLLLTLFAG